MSELSTRRQRLVALLVGLCLGLSGCNENATRAQATAGTPISAPASAGAAAPPVISGTPAQTTVSVGQAFRFTPTAGSPSGAPLAFLLLNGPAFLSVNSATGVLSGTPAMIDIGTYPNIHLAVTDGVTTVAGPAFTLTVVADVTQPTTPTVTGSLTISGSPITLAVEGVAWTFRPVITVTGSSAALAFRVANLPSWATFNTTSGTLSGTPPAGAAGNYLNIVVSVSDTAAEAALPAFSLAVVKQQPPVISGKPVASAQAGATYVFRPTATDPNGGSLVYTINGKPAWASFDPTTGTLSGKPATADVGSSSRVTITATDGFASASLAPFTLAVVAPVSGTATLSWVAPQQRTDGTQLTNLAGFRIYYGTSSGSYPNSVSVTNPNLVSYTIDALPVGTYFFVTTAFDATGNESSYSTPVSKTIQ